MLATRAKKKIRCPPAIAFPSLMIPHKAYRTGRSLSGSGGSSIVMVLCSRSGPVRYRACSLAIAVAVQAKDASRIQPQEHVIRHREPRSVTRARESAPSPARPRGSAAPSP